MVVVPKFMMTALGADGGTTVLAPTIGAEYARGTSRFEYNLWLTFSRYGFDDAPFKAKSDPDTAWELVRSDLKLINAGADVLWSTALGRDVSFTYGAGAGLGVVFGNLYRTQAYPPAGVPGDPDSYSPCAAPSVPNPNYCGTDNDHYGDYKEPSWFNGGAKPVVFPWIALPQIGLRWKPSSSVALRLDTGLSFPGPFFVGVSSQYRLPQDRR